MKIKGNKEKKRKKKRSISIRSSQDWEEKMVIKTKNGARWQYEQQQQCKTLDKDFHAESLTIITNDEEPRRVSARVANGTYIEEKWRLIWWYRKHSAHSHCNHRVNRTGWRHQCYCSDDDSESDTCWYISDSNSLTTEHKAGLQSLFNEDGVSILCPWQWLTLWCSNIHIILYKYTSSKTKLLCI
jgi:hypothetical protein